MLISLLCLLVLNNPTFAEDGSQLTPCQAEVLRAYAAHRPGQFIPKCTPDGQYNSRQCDPTVQQCWCVDANGNELEGKRQGLNEWIPCDGESAAPTRCQADVARVLATNIPGVYIPMCDDNGDYHQTQCYPSEAHCWCVTTDGHIIDGTEMGPYDSYPNCDRTVTQCQLEAQNAMAQQTSGASFIPQCDGMGAYKPKQCTESGICWCVDSNGVEISETKSDSSITCGPCSGLDCEATGACHVENDVCVCFNGASPSSSCDPCEGQACSNYGSDEDSSNDDRSCVSGLQFLGHCTCKNGAALDICTPGPCNGLFCQQDGTCEVRDGACVCLNGGALPDCVPQTCMTAWPLTCNAQGVNQPWLNTASATVQGSYPCRDVEHTAPQGWYSLTLADDTKVDLIQCTTAGFRSRISVFTGDCSTPQCVAAAEAALGDDGKGSNGDEKRNDEDGDGHDQSEITCRTALSSRLAAGTYYIMAHGIAGTVGLSTLSAVCDPCGGLPCKTAESCQAQGAACRCLNGLALPTCDPCAGKGCATAGTCEASGGTCRCTNDALLENDCRYLDVPSNDQCTNGQPITCGSHVTGTLWHADQSRSCHSGGPDVWYTLSVTEDSTVSISMCKGRNFDSYMVLMNNCDDINCKGENDDSRHCGSGSTISTDLAKGTYNVMVREYAGHRGNFTFTLDVTCIPQGTNPCASYDCYSKEDCVVDGAFCACNNGAQPPYCDACFGRACQLKRTCQSRGPSCKCINGGTGVDCLLPPVSNAPKNDDCSGALPITCGSQTPGSTKYATPSSLDRNKLDVWYVLDLDQSSAVTLSICDPLTYDFDPALVLVDGTCANPRVLQSNDDSLQCGKGPFISAPMLRAGKYYVVVRGVSKASGQFRLDVECNPGVTNRRDNEAEDAEGIARAVEDSQPSGGWQTWGITIVVSGLLLVQAAVAAVWWNSHRQTTSTKSGPASPGTGRKDSLRSVVSDTDSLLRQRSGY